MNTPIDFLSVGDIVSEPFIRLTSTVQEDETKEHGPLICLPLGEKIPYESATLCVGVGNAANAAVSAARLGLSTALHAYTGDDEYGSQMHASLKENGVLTDFMVTEPGKQSNYHYVLWYGNERTILVKHESYTYTVPSIALGPKWLYLTSLAANALPYENELVSLLDTAWKDTKLAFQPGTYQLQAGAEACRELYAKSYIVFCNKEEAQRILKTTSNDMRTLLTGMRSLGPTVSVITDGTNGAYAANESNAWFVPMYPDSRGPYERTGAGDAFASTVVAALALGKSLEESLLWGPINSMAVVQEVGAQSGLLSRSALEKYVASAPTTYAIKNLP
jgi:sugar/nucleoside kinase (ribokinase family)